MPRDSVASPKVAFRVEQHSGYEDKVSTARSATAMARTEYHTSIPALRPPTIALRTLRETPSRDRDLPSQDVHIRLRLIFSVRDVVCGIFSILYAGIMRQIYSQSITLVHSQLHTTYCRPTSGENGSGIGLDKLGSWGKWHIYAHRNTWVGTSRRAWDWMSESDNGRRRTS